MKPITISFVYFRSLNLDHLEAALYSVRRQDFSSVERLVVVDNNTDDELWRIEAIVKRLAFPVPVAIQSHKHHDSTKTHSWSTNVAVRAGFTPWIFFTRADYLLEFDIVKQFVGEINDRSAMWNGFITSTGCYLGENLVSHEQTLWRQNGPYLLGRTGLTYDHTSIDAGVWMAKRDAFDLVGGLNEKLTAWGHAQTHFQWKLYKNGVEFRRIPEVLFYHLDHGGGEKDLGVANQPLAEQGIDLHEMWARYEGQRPY